jgi:fucokinase
MDMDCRPTFTHVVVTSPTPQTALAYEIQMQELRTALPCLAHTDVLSVADPVGDRIGSGGGTINAVKHFTEKYGVDGLRTARILVVHSGGDSRRIPIHSGA